MQPNPQFPADLVTFTKEILNEKLHFFCAVKGYKLICVENSELLSANDLLVIFSRDYGESNTNKIQNTAPGNICLFKVNNRKTRKRYEICSKLTKKIPERHL